MMWVLLVLVVPWAVPMLVTWEPLVFHSLLRQHDRMWLL